MTLSYHAVWITAETLRSERAALRSTLGGVLPDGVVDPTIRSVMQAADEGRSTYDILAGMPANKAAWSNDAVVTRDRRAVRLSPTGTAFYLPYLSAKPALKAPLERLDLLLHWTRLKARVLDRHVKDTDRNE